LNHDADGIPMKQNSDTPTKLPALVSDELAKELAEQAKLAFISLECKH